MRSVNGKNLAEGERDLGHATEHRQIEEQVEATQDKMAEPNAQSDQQEKVLGDTLRTTT